MMKVELKSRTLVSWKDLFHDSIKKRELSLKIKGVEENVMVLGRGSNCDGYCLDKMSFNFMSPSYGPLRT